MYDGKSVCFNEFDGTELKQTWAGYRWPSRVLFWLLFGVDSHARAGLSTVGLNEDRRWA